MAARVQIVDAKIPQTGISKLRGLAEGLAVEEIAAPRVAAAFNTFLNSVARGAASRFPYRRTGRTASAIRGGARVTGGSNFSSIRGYFFVEPYVAAQEYGARIKARRTKYLAIPIADGLNPDGSPKRTGPRAWSQYKTFVWTNKNTGRKYIVYSRKRGRPFRLAFLYVLIPWVRVRATRTIRTEYDRQFPELYAKIATIIRDAMTKAYAARVKEAERKLKLSQTVPITKSGTVRAYVAANPKQTAVRVPDPSLYSPTLVPRY